jgi:molybdate transport system substrate-binding protein
MATAVLAASLGCSGLQAQTPAPAAEVRVLSTNAVKSAIEELHPQMERAAGRRVAVQFDSTQRLMGMINAGQGFDVAILSTNAINELIQKGMIASGTRTDIGRTGIGVGVRAGTTKPDVSTPEALRRTLLNAKSIAMNPAGASFVHFNRVVERMGIAAQIKPKLMLDAEPGRPQANVAEGKAELIWTQIPEIRFVPGLEVAGPLPGELQLYTSFAAGVAGRASNAEPARTVVRFLAGPAATAILRGKDVEAP